jgi:hypothetical protein
MPINQETQTKIVGALQLGMPLGNVADYVTLPLEQIQQEMNTSPDFKAAVNKAIAECMHKRLTKLEELENWQALAFILESLWPTRFGRKSRGSRRLRAKRPSTKDDLDFDRLSPEEQDHLEHLLAKAHGRTRPRRSDTHVPVVGRVEPKLLS